MAATPVETMASGVHAPVAAAPVVAILAGGGSRRMGRDKATIELNGEPVIQSIARAASGAGLRVVVVGRASFGRDTGINDERRAGINDERRAGTSDEGRTGADGVRGTYSEDGPRKGADDERSPREGRIDGIDAWLEDETPGEGPLAALATALRRLGSEIILVACDMPLLDTAAFEWLAQAPLAADSTALVPRNDDTLEPLFARYRTAALPAIDTVLAEGRRSIGALIEKGGVTIVDVPAWLRPRLANVNTPEELDRVASARGDR